ncbi:hypothetical protein B0H16DRAFT_1890215 [Mycena metata]|uniref:F-box domain-containing protein n=1 Tax=Mycena metata TaxID=1033252 RepID=A0AAD7IGF1_9AGAR|nr:hypothetical protein B0H16DRAFT_1890215 [Mycena metata]
MADPRSQRTARERAADRARLVDIAAQITDLQCSLQALRAEKKLLEAEQETLQDRLDAYTYPVLTLPPEVMSEIFVHFLPVYPERAPQKGLLSPITLGQICRLWRQIAFSTPSLWRTFKLFLRPGGSVQRYEADHTHTETSLQRSGSCPLSVEVEHAQYNTPSVLHLVLAHRTRWEHLKLFVSVRNLPVIIGPFPLLRTLTTTVWVGGLHDETYRPATFHSAPLLRRVAIDNYKNIFLSMLPWSQLTVLVIKSIDINPCVHVLALAPNLVYCDFTFFRLGEGETARQVTLARLKDLKLRGPDQLWDHTPILNPLGVLALPAFQRLHIDEASLLPDPIAALQSLLSHWGSSPRDIRIGFPSQPFAMYPAALPAIMFSYTRHRPLAIRFLEWQPTTLVGLEAANIDEEGDWDETPLIESEESTSDSGRELDAREGGTDSDLE